MPLAAIPESFALQSNIQAGQATGSQWSNPANALTPDANYASTTTDGAGLVLTGFLTSGFSGQISSVSLQVDQSQPGHLDDEITVRQNDPGGCGSSTSPLTQDASGSRSVLAFGLNCPNGWTWTRIQALQTTIEATANLLADGEFRAHYAYLQVVYTNGKPIANAGADRTVAEATTVSLDGRASSDPDGDQLTYLWTQTAGLNVQISNPNAGLASFQAPAMSSGQQALLDFQLRVTDAVGNQATDTIRITVANANLAPLADAGADLHVEGGATVTLDGSGSSDPDTDPITYQWTQTFGPSVDLSDRTAARPTFRAPAFSSTVEFGLVVSDNAGVRSDPDVVVVFVAGSTAPPAEGDDGGGTDSGGGPTGNESGDPPPAEGVAVAIRLDPPSLRLAPGESAPVRVHGFDANGQRVAIRDCTWDDDRSGGTLEIAGDCLGTFRAGDRLGLHFELVAKVATPSGLLSAGAPLVIAASAAPLPGDVPPAPDQPLTCTALIDPRDGSRQMPVGFDERCALEMVVLEWRSRPEETVRLIAEPLPEWPEDVPAPPGRHVEGRILDIRVQEEDGGSVMAERATIHFAVPRAWLAAECPPATCMVRLFHYHDGAWDSLPAERVGEDDDEVEYSAETESFSLFVPGGVPIPKASQAGGGFSWGTAMAWVGLVASAVLLALFLVKRLGGGSARRSRAVTESLPPAPVAVPKKVPGGALKVAPADLVPLVKTVLRSYADRAAAASVNVELAGDGLSLPVVIDRIRVGQAATLLLDVAARTAQAEGSVEVRLREQDGYAVVEFEEEPGKAWSSDVPRPLPKVDLSPAVAIIEGHGGRVWAKNGRNHAWGFMVPLRTAAHALEDESG